MKEFRSDRVARRQIKIKSSDRAIADAVWALEIGVMGVSMWKKGQREDRYHLSWRSIVSHALIHSARKKT